MDWKESTHTIHIPKTVCDEYEERGVDLDIVLPDYCPDVTAILKYVMKPTITTRHQSGDRYTVDGVVSVRILYLSEDREEVHCYEATQPFSAGFRCSGAVHYHVETMNEYINCRAISPRRMDIHGAFRIHLCAVDEGTATVFQDPCRREVFCKNETVTATVPMSEYEKTIVINEAIHLGVQADSLLYTDISVSSCEHKLLTNKAILKGVLLLKVVFSKGKVLHSVKHEIPFSQIIDVEGLSDEVVCETEVYCCEKECILRQSDNGASILEVSGKLNGIIRCNRRETISVVLDVYSVKEALLSQTVPLRFHSKKGKQQQKVSYQEYTSIPEGLSEIEDQWGELKSCELSEGPDGKKLCFGITICMIARNIDGHLGYYERMLEFTANCEDSVKQAYINAIDATCTVSGDQICVRIDTEQCHSYEEEVTLTAVSQIAVDTKQTFSRPAATIRIVYANEGESLWDIAKANHSSVDDICAENNLTDKTIHTAMMLMIPMF